jgi:hypothetical protein
MQTGDSGKEQEVRHRPGTVAVKPRSCGWDGIDQLDDDGQALACRSCT